uniref:Uncharacterized protein n=1 Tax=Romanomermis culicivorax TaxID=13658 RepID=A0A915J3P0_ROMCU
MAVLLNCNGHIPFGFPFWVPHLAELHFALDACLQSLHVVEDQREGHQASGDGHRAEDNGHEGHGPQTVRRLFFAVLFVGDHYFVYMETIWKMEDNGSMCQEIDFYTHENSERPNFLTI